MDSRSVEVAPPVSGLLLDYALLGTLGWNSSTGGVVVPKFSGKPVPTCEKTTDPAFVRLVEQMGTLRISVLNHQAGQHRPRAKSQDRKSTRLNSSHLGI